MEEDISIILKPLRKLILSENSLEPKKHVFLLNHVHNFINLEKRIALKSSKKEIKLRIRLKEKDATVNLNKSEETEKANKNLLPTEEEVHFAKYAISVWEQSTSEMIGLIQENKGQQVLDSLLAASQLNTVCKRGIVFCLVILIKRSKDLNIVAKGYSAVAQICKSSHLFLLFLELCKIYTAAETKSSGWGRGMKRAIRNWYLQWDPKLLALEVIRYPSAYTWSHKDVLKMAHISLKDLPTETKVVLNFIFSGYKSTKEKYGSEENAKDLIQLLEILHKGSQVTNCDASIERGKNILSKYGSISLSDFPTQTLNDVKVMTFLLENGSPPLIIEALATTSLFKLVSDNVDLRTLLLKQIEKGEFSQQIDPLRTIIAYNNCRRISADLLDVDGTEAATREKQWMKAASPNPDKAKKLRIIVPRPKPIDDVFVALSKLVTDSTKNIAKLGKKCLIFVEIEPSIDGFVAVSPEDPISKEVRGTQVISFLILSMISDETGVDSVLPTLEQKLKKSEEAKIPCTFTVLQNSLSKVAKKQVDRINIEQAFKTTLEKKAPICLFLYYKLTKEIVQDITDNFTKVKNQQNPATELRVVVCGLEWNSDISVTSQEHSDLIMLFGFNRFVLPVIQAFSNALL